MKTENFTACQKLKTKKKASAGSLVYVNSTNKTWHCVKNVQIRKYGKIKKLRIWILFSQ